MAKETTTKTTSQATSANVEAIELGGDVILDTVIAIADATRAMVVNGKRPSNIAVLGETIAAARELRKSLSTGE